MVGRQSRPGGGAGLAAPGCRGAGGRLDAAVFGCWSGEVVEDELAEPDEGRDRDADEGGPGGVLGDRPGDAGTDRAEDQAEQEAPHSAPAAVTIRSWASLKSFVSSPIHGTVFCIAVRMSTAL